MTAQTYKLQGGEFKLSESSLIFNDGTNVISIKREHIGEIFKMPMKILLHNQVVYIFRFALFGVVLLAFGLYYSYTKNQNIIAWVGIATIIFSGFLLFAFFFLDGLLGIKIAQPILLAFFGRKLVKVVIQNTEGQNNFEFYINNSEIEKADEIINSAIT